MILPGVHIEKIIVLLEKGLLILLRPTLNGCFSPCTAKCLAMMNIFDRGEGYEKKTVGMQHWPDSICSYH